MSFETSSEKSPFEIEQERLVSCFYEEKCPFCEADVNEELQARHLGFCNEHHLHDYQVKHSTDVRLAFIETRGKRDHADYCQEWADKLNISIELFKTLHDDQNFSPEQIDEYLKKQEGREAA